MRFEGANDRLSVGSPGSRMPVTQEQIDAAEIQISEQSRRIEFFITEYSVELLANKMEDDEFDIPPYQREDTWEDARKSKFIESLLMGLPIPFLFFWERGDGKLEIVDGSQIGALHAADDLYPLRRKIAIETRQF